MGSMLVEIGVWSLIIGFAVLANTDNLFIFRKQKKDLDDYKKSRSENLQPSSDMQFAHQNFIVRKITWSLIIFGFIVSLIGISYIYLKGE